jgi:hypothetical protein
LGPHSPLYKEIGIFAAQAVSQSKLEKPGDCSIPLDTVWHRRFSGPSVDGRGQDGLEFRYEIKPSYPNSRRDKSKDKPHRLAQILMGAWCSKVPGRALTSSEQKFRHRQR